MRFLALVILGISAIACSAEDQTKPRISESFAKAGVRAVVVIDDSPNSERANRALEDAKVEHDPNNIYEVIMYSHLLNFQLSRQIKDLPGCAIDLGNAFRHRLYLSELPKTCK